MKKIKCFFNYRQVQALFKRALKDSDVYNYNAFINIVTFNTLNIDIHSFILGTAIC